MLALDLDRIIEKLAYDPKEPLLFNSGFFIWYFAAFIITYSLVASSRNGRIYTFVLFSLYFFYKACGWYVGLVLFSAVADFILSNTIYKTKQAGRKKTIADHQRGA